MTLCTLMQGLDRALGGREPYIDVNILTYQGTWLLTSHPAEKLTSSSFKAQCLTPKCMKLWPISSDIYSILGLVSKSVRILVHLGIL